MPSISSHSLSSVLKRIRAILEEKVSIYKIWIRAELSSIKLHRPTGHYYLDLVETKGTVTVAKCSATIWNSNAIRIKSELKSDFENILKNGNEFLFLANITFSELYGLSLNIHQVDLNFSLGDLEKRKQATIKQLSAEGLLDLNKQKPIPRVVQKIALIGSPGTDGYVDFNKQLKQNAYGFVFEVTDFPASVQGDNAVDEICMQLEKLNNYRFDCIVLIRGGGSKLDLDVFNQYKLAKTIATHNLPVFTGIGHENDFSVVDMVAARYFKTPSALGAHIVENARNFQVEVNTYWVYIKEIYSRYIDNQKAWLELNIHTLTTKSISTTQLRRGELHTTMNRINSLIAYELNNEKQRLALAKEILSTKPGMLIQQRRTEVKNSLVLIQMGISSKITQAVDNNNFILSMISSISVNQCREKRNNLENILQIIGGYHPKSILTKGYAIPRHKGKLLTDQHLYINDTIELELHNRTLLVSFIKQK